MADGAAPTRDEEEFVINGELLPAIRELVNNDEAEVVINIRHKNKHTASTTTPEPDEQVPQTETQPEPVVLAPVPYVPTPVRISGERVEQPVDHELVGEGHPPHVKLIRQNLFKESLGHPRYAKHREILRILRDPNNPQVSEVE